MKEELQSVDMIKPDEGIDPADSFAVYAFGSTRFFKRGEAFGLPFARFFGFSVRVFFKVEGDRIYVLTDDRNAYTEMIKRARVIANVRKDASAAIKALEKASASIRKIRAVADSADFEIVPAKTRAAEDLESIVDLVDRLRDYIDGDKDFFERPDPVASEGDKELFDRRARERIGRIIDNLDEIEAKDGDE